MITNVAIGILEHDNQILFVKRNNNSYQGLWGLPGGKIERMEHLDEAVIREFKEETKQEVNFKELIGVISELINEKDRNEHVILYLCTLEVPVPQDISDGNLSWIPKNEINMRNDIIPSDVLILDYYMYKKTRNFYLRLESVQTEDGTYLAKESLPYG
ncbi:NUDIX hydrolase [Paenibacillus ginsengihumi]|uniref:NUDIX hydrolase n=1 Tax=Paenibacillus ginsengihumi TaxID=431596 RepID=UPI00036A0E97|nr:NUDIX domain-containing protein [Paenibacillus ginsengihumi]